MPRPLTKPRRPAPPLVRDWSLVGIPDHQGVENVGGRLGAALGPAAFRRCFGRLKGRDGVHSALRDLGDAPGITADVRANHRQAATLVRDAHPNGGGLSVVVGGGHDHGFSHLLGLTRAYEGARLGCINIDAHLDVRKAAPVIGSGSPFYLAIEEGIMDPRRFIEFGIQPHCNALELWTYIENKKVAVVPFARLRNGAAPKAFAAAIRKLSASCDHVAVSLDLDAAAEAYAPGVSAPQAEGFTSSDVIEMMEIAGISPKVVSLGIFELNPLHDVADRTARLAATAAYHFVAHALGRA